MALFAGLLLCAGSAAAEKREVHDTISAEELAAALTAAGLAPTVLTDRATGAPVVTGISDGLVFVVRALECSGLPARCEQLVLFANFDLGRAVTDADFRVVNGFNDSSVHGRAYVLENRRQIGVDFTIDMVGGVTSDHVDERLKRWPELIRTFRDQMRNAQTGS